MSRLHLHTERHAVARIGWLRAAVLGANDGIVSTASLVVGFACCAGAEVAANMRTIVIDEGGESYRSLR
jgi:VIT1/CCC1 family predicted Fe2+/Mn2+ transporter